MDKKIFEMLSIIVETNDCPDEDIECNECPIDNKCLAYKHRGNKGNNKYNPDFNLRQAAKEKLTELMP